MPMTQKKTMSRRFLRGLGVTLCAGLAASSLIVVPARDTFASANLGSNVAYSSPAYERDQVLEVGGKPFFYNGVQIRIDKVKDVYGYTDAQIKNLFQVAKNDGFTVANVQMRWADIQPDTTIAAESTATISEMAPGLVQAGNLKVEGSSSNGENYTYLRYNVSQLPNTVEAAKIRVYLPDPSNDLTQSHNLTAYDVTGQAASTNLSALTWNNAPVKSTNGLSGASNASYDSIRGFGYYDIDVTNLLKNQLANGSNAAVFMLGSASTDGQNAETITLDRNAQAPRLIVSENKNAYDWSYLDKIIGYADDANIKLELLWFGTDTVGITADNRVPFYVFHNYKKSMADVNKPFWSKQTGDAATTYGAYWYLMDKNDTNLQLQESSAVKAMMNHVAAYNSSHGYQNRVIGVQVANEPMISMLHMEKVYDSNGNAVPHSMDSDSLALKAQLGLNDQQFRDYTMFHYINNLAKAVKTSNYPVWTRVNNITSNDAWGVTYNENRRAQGGTDTDSGTYLDFIGLDPYNYNRAQLFGFGHGDVGLGDYSTGENLPMVMESSGARSMSALMDLATIAGGAYYNVYDLVSPDGNNLYDQNMQPRVVPAGDKYLPNGGTYINDVRGTNQMLNQIAYELATKNPDSLGGSDLLFFNAEGTELTTINLTKQLAGLNVTYHSDTKYSVGIATKRSDTEIVLENTLDNDATFTLNGISAGKVESVTSGRYNTQTQQWVEDNTASYQGSGNSVVVTMPQYSSVRVTLKKCGNQQQCVWHSHSHR
ncbi:hypothetical protein FHS19_000023 [Paenibacillus rhizosphaerae]|uniref:Carbohydrate-binding module family 96 domain-containing protein n=1 Tax=Paenibacillus rhizosphaerae TaxID=297318 RepID=A0A839TJ50_9BACL|nr:DUF4978 domain-containing protein [Paenibacillus rhizosphaerae]MBB3125369.1 hypothetical protein [Paenibacillus rhizosphaerae]